MWIIASDKRNGNEQLSLIVAKGINHIGFNAKEKKGGNSFKGVEVIIAVIQTCFDDLKFKETTYGYGHLGQTGCLACRYYLN
jgi:hypothetical protein